MDAVGGSWAGTLACSACRRKRLTAEAFSGSQLRQLRERKIAEDKLKCKECIAAVQAAERERFVTEVRVLAHASNYEVTLNTRLVLHWHGLFVMVYDNGSAFFEVLHYDSCWDTRSFAEGEVIPSTLATTKPFLAYVGVSTRSA